MRKLAIIFFAFGLFVSLTSYAQEIAEWNLARDLQVSFTQGANGVWYFMESESLVHDPAVYRLLPRYLNPCQAADHTGVFAGVGCWQGTEAHGPCCGLKTEVAFNFTNDLPGFCVWDWDCLPPHAGYLPHSARLLANWDRFAIVAWQSPLTGMVKVRARFGWRNTFQVTHVNWSFDKGKQTLRSGVLFGAELAGQVNSQLKVAKGEVLYFIVDDSPAAASFTFNPVDLRVTITQVQ